MLRHNIERMVSNFLNQMYVSIVDMISSGDIKATDSVETLLKVILKKRAELSE